MALLSAGGVIFATGLLFAWLAHRQTRRNRQASLDN